MLQLGVDHHNSSFGLGVRVQRPGSTSRPLDGTTVQRAPFDNFLDFIDDFMVDVGSISTGELFPGSPWSNSYKGVVPFYGWHPVNWVSDRRDWTNESSRVALLSDLIFNGLDSVRSRYIADAPGGENNLEHTNVRGSIRHKLNRLRIVPYGRTHFLGFPQFSTFKASYSAVKLNNHLTDNYTLATQNVTYSNSLICYLCDGLVRIGELIGSGYFNKSNQPTGIAGMSYSNQYSDFSYVLDVWDSKAVRSISYTYNITFTGGPCFDSETVTYQTVMSWETIPNPPCFSSNAPGTYNFSSGTSRVKQVLSYLLTDKVTINLRPVSGPYVYGGYSTTSSDVWTLVPHATTYPVGESSSIEEVKAMFSDSWTPLGGAIPGRRLDSFHSEVYRDIANFQPLRFLAYTEAITNCFIVMDTNLAEFIGEFKEVLALLDFSTYKGLFFKPGRKYIDKETTYHLRGIGDILSSAYLMQKYGIRPLIGTIAEFTKKFGAVLEQFKDFAGETVTSYGSHSFDLPPGTYGYSTARATASSKIVGRFNTDSLWLGAYFADAIGLFPTLERMWDIKSDSFILDMFFNIDDRLKLFDGGFRAAGFVLDYHVSTIKVDANLDNSILNHYNLELVGPEVPMLRYITRNVSRVSPSIGSSAYDLFPQQNIDWFALGSLVFQRVK